MKTKTILAALTLTVFSISANAEFRVWTDAKGKTIEAELMQVLNNQVVLKLVNGRDIKVSLDTLSAEDRQRAMLSQPPTLELDVSAKTDRVNSSLFQVGRGSRVQIQQETTVVSVDVLKQSAATYEEPLKAVLYVMGQRNGEQVAVLDKVSMTFAYTDTSKEFAFATDAYESEKREDVIHGEEYQGWLVAVFDSNGEIVAMKSSDPKYGENAEALLEEKKGAVLTADYEIATPDLAKYRRL